MRNGNIPLTKSNRFAFSGSYRTYEEWKPRFRNTISTEVHRSYRTYEEWKLQFLKQFHKFNQVLTVPMRNGNYKI